MECYDVTDLYYVAYKVGELLVVLDLLFIVLDRFLHFGAFVIKSHGFRSHDLA